MRAAKVQASLCIRAVSPEPSLLAHTSSESRGTFRQKARSLAPLNGWACAVKICHDGMLEDTNSLGGAHIILSQQFNVLIFTAMTSVVLQWCRLIQTKNGLFVAVTIWRNNFPLLSSSTFKTGVNSKFDSTCYRIICNTTIYSAVLQMQIKIYWLKRICLLCVKQATQGLLLSSPCWTAVWKNNRYPIISGNTIC